LNNKIKKIIVDLKNSGEMARININVHDNGDEEERVSEWGQFVRTAAVQTLLYPFEYAKVLMQVSFDQ
jgi:hypothetical protein